MDELKSFTVKRSKWDRGSDNSQLLSGNKSKCCIGFACLAMGLTDAEILDQSIYSEVRDRDFYNAELNAIFSQAYAINDDADIFDDAREQKLIDLFASHGIGIKFED